MKHKLLFIKFVALVAAMMYALGASAAEAYACYTPSNTTLTFYYDNLRSSRSGTTYNLNYGAFRPEWYNDGTSRYVTRVVFDQSFANAHVLTTYSWFYNMYSLQSITGMQYLNTANVTNMNGMFYNCSSLTSLDVSNFNTANVTTMRAVFYECSSLASLNLSSFNTSNVTDMSYMFYDCSSLMTVYVGNGWSTVSVTQSEDMFKKSTNLVGCMGTWYDASHIDATYAHIDGGTSNPGYFTAEGAQPWAGNDAYACYTPSNTTLTFYYDGLRSTREGTVYHLNTGYDFPNWENDGSNANVTRVVFDPSFANARPTTTVCWFYEMHNLQSITGISFLNTTEVTDMSGMFYGCNSLRRLNVSHFNTGNVTDMMKMFFNCSGLTSLDMSNFNTANVTSMESMFSSCRALTSLDLSHFNTANVTNMSAMFYDCNALTTIYAGNGWSTAAVTSSVNMFIYSTNLVGGMGTRYNAGHIDAAYAHIDGGTSNPGYFTAEGAEPWVAREAYANYTSSNTTLTFYYDDLRGTREGKTYSLNLGSTIPGWCTDETNADVTQVVFNSSFANARPTTTFEWFFEMQNLQSITGMQYLNTSQVTNMRFMFYKCSSLTSLDLSSFNTANVTDMRSMFYNCQMLRTIYAGNAWSTAAVTSSDDMFTYSTSLVGGKGTTYDANHVDKAYARIDGGTSNPGYFTAEGAEPWREAYACYTPSNTTLTFYYDHLRNSRTGTTYDLNEGFTSPGWRTDGMYSSVTKVIFHSDFSNARPTSTYRWFCDMQNLETITGISYLNTSEVTEMRYMFYNCSKLTSIDLSHFNTAKVTNMGYMFSSCSALTNLDVHYLKTDQVTDMRGMFSNTSALTSMYLIDFNTAKVTNMSYMFYGCSNMTAIYVDGTWNTAAVTSSGNMFYNCTKLMGGMGTTYDANHIDKAYAHIDGGTSYPGYFTEYEGPEAYACYMPNGTMTFYYDTFRDRHTSMGGWTYALNSGSNSPDWYNDGISANVKTVVFNRSFADYYPTSTNHWFAEMSELTSVQGTQYLNTSEVTDMSWMFSLCWGMETFDLSHFDTQNVTNMSYMFNYCEGMTSLDLSHFDTQNVWTMEGMFYECSALPELDLSGFNTQNVMNFKEMFYDCASLTSLDLSHFDTRNAATMNGMFSDCSGLTSLNLSGFNTQHVDNMNNMFGGCLSLTSLDLSSFDADYLTNTNWMFSNCRALTTVYVSENWDASDVENSDNMFKNCTSIRGGKGTTYDANHIDAAYAHIDGGPNDPGYFTAMVKYDPVMLPADEQYIDMTSFRADWTDETEAILVDNYTLEVNPIFDPVLLDRLEGSEWSYYDDGYYDWDFDEPWGGVNTRVGRGNIYFKNNYNGNATGCLTFTIPDGYTNATFSLVITSGSEYGAGNFTVYTPQTPAVGHDFWPGETYSWMVTASSGEKITVYTTDEDYSPDIALIEVHFTGYPSQLITGITDKFCTVENLEAGGTYQYRVKTHYINGTESEWSNIEEVTLSESTHFLRGDVNGDGEVNISDAIMLINYLLNGTAEGINLDAADCNEDSDVNITDAIVLINFLLNGTW